MRQLSWLPLSKRRARSVGMMALAALIVAGCASAPAATAKLSSNSTKAGSTLTISNEEGTTWTCGFNPFNSAVNYLSFGPVYEELVFVDTLKSGATTPWLAKSFAWSNGNKTLTFTIRSGVKWSDGYPLTAKDVAYTFNLLKSQPGLDLNAVWTVLTSVSVQNLNQVVFDFTTPSVPFFYYIADQTPIVPEHIWSKIANPVTYSDSQPVGTGPYAVSACNPENVRYTANRHYWQPGLPKVETVDYPAFTSNDPANELLATGGAQWGSQYIPSIKTYYLSKSANYHTWSPAYANYSLFPNLTDPTLNNVAVRQAMAYAIDRPQISTIDNNSQLPAANQSDIVTPTYKSWYDSTLASQYDYTYDPSRAISILKKAGFKESGGIFHTPSGQPLSYTIDNVGGDSNSVSAVNTIVADLTKVGIQATVDELSQITFDTDLYDGDYQLAYWYENGGPTPYYELRQLLDSANSAPVGSAAASDWERYSSSATDGLLRDYSADTSIASQHATVDKLEQVMLKEVPVIPIVEYVAWNQYDTAHFGGFVTPSDPYALPGAYITPDFGVVLLHIFPKK